MLIAEVMFGLWLYSLFGAITRLSRRDLRDTSAFAEGATAFLWPAYWACMAFGAVAVVAYLALSGAWVMSAIEWRRRRRA